MANTCHIVKGTDRPPDGIAGKVDIDRGGMQGFMSHKSFYGKQIRSIFIQMCTKSMAEGMAGKPALPSQPVLVGMDVPREEEGINRSVLTALLREEISHRTVTFKPILCQKVKGCFRKNGIPVISAFRVCDVKPHIFTVDIFIAEPADFTYAKTGGVHEGKHGFRL